ncbi:hypothetical protein M378DRAFT_164014 [Amanita muscaria Koide BX008]|uniref:Uncharacterized protein n=1 Tax=Amanita muscaria (strain Koide BX008) TaxID=946122 RepID=A0A0C2X523_AMAMK|nr:hypothetical protein M378DRAFT_164014 [Amanita muscaria Koide BX008]
MAKDRAETNVNRLYDEVYQLRQDSMGPVSDTPTTVGPMTPINSRVRSVPNRPFNFS